MGFPHLVAHVDLGEAEGAEVGVGSLHRRLNGLSEQLVHKLADERPHLLHRLTESRDKQRVNWVDIFHITALTGQKFRVKRLVL